jgi:hypothetical protein
MNVTKYVGSLLTTFSDAGSTPAASTMFKLFIFMLLTVHTFVPVYMKRTADNDAFRFLFTV